MSEGIIHTRNLGLDENQLSFVEEIQGNHGEGGIWYSCFKFCFGKYNEGSIKIK